LNQGDSNRKAEQSTLKKEKETEECQSLASNKLLNLKKRASMATLIPLLIGTPVAKIRTIGEIAFCKSNP
jgi:hypothetical protein